MHTQREEQRVENEGSTDPKQAGRGPSQSHDNSNEQQVSDCSLLLLAPCTAKAPQHELAIEALAKNLAGEAALGHFQQSALEPIKQAL